MALKKLVSKLKKEAKEYKLEKRKLQALEKAAFEGQKKLEKERKQKERAEAAVKRGIARAKREPTKEAVKLIKRAAEALADEEKPKKKAKKKPAQKTPTDKFKTINISGKRYTLNTIKPNKSMADKTKENLKAKGKLVRVVKRRDGYFIYTRSK